MIDYEALREEAGDKVDTLERRYGMPVEVEDVINAYEQACQDLLQDKIVLGIEEVRAAREEDVVCLLGWSESCSRKCKEDTPAQHDLCKKLTLFARGEVRKED